MALPNDISRITLALAKLEASNPNYTDDANKEKAARLLARQQWQFKTANVAANASLVGNVSEKLRPGFAARVLGVWFSPDFTLDVSANASNYATMALKEVYANGAMGNVIASVTLRPTANSGTGNLSVGVPVEFTVDSANYRIANTTQLAPDIAQTAGGIAAVAGSWTVSIEPEGVDAYAV